MFIHKIVLYTHDCDCKHLKIDNRYDIYIYIHMLIELYIESIMYLQNIYIYIYHYDVTLSMHGSVVLQLG